MLKENNTQQDNTTQQLKAWVCSNCKATRTTEDNIVLKLCGCGEYMQLENKQEVLK